jgi:glycosyltransferase involved in cell wall biosynthesis
VTTVTVIATIRNEEKSIGALIESLLRQTRKPDEIVFADGGSNDATASIIQGYISQGAPIKLLLVPGANISQGRNAAIQQARGEIIASTDAGVRLDSKWLEELIKPFENSVANSPEKPADVVCGFFLPDPYTAFEVAMGATVLPALNEIKAESFLPSSRSVAFRKNAWQAVHGYPEGLDYCEDLVFDLDLKRKDFRFVLAPTALVHFRPRSNFRAFFRQYYLYARGDGKANLWRKRHAIRYATYLIATPLLLLAGLKIHKLAWLLFLPGGMVYLRQPYQRLPVVMRRLPRVTPRDWLYAAALVPGIRVVGDVAKMLGYPAGWLWRLRNKPPDWKG